jgi:hypothetical protein
MAAWLIIHASDGECMLDRSSAPEWVANRTAPPRDGVIASFGGCR